jgi:formylglycine-generating enzyme required for sulfatase activity
MPNDFGLFDMQGNVLCWCQEEFKSYPVSAVEDVEDGSLVSRNRSRALRGGAFEIISSQTRSAARYASPPEARQMLFGFRPARTWR